jgi:hypothetical protein
MKARALLAAVAALSCGKHPLAPQDGGLDRATTADDAPAIDQLINPPGPDASLPPADAGGRRTFNVDELASGDVDILFMVDNSRSMLPLQQKLLINFPVFMQTLETLPRGLPNVHIAVVSSDMGSGANLVELCNNDQGIFRSTVGPSAQGTCSAGTGLLPNQSFISNVNGQANYSGKIEDVFSCIAALGQDGCGFEAQLASVVRALGADGNPPPAENTGFLRPNAMLAIILITNEDDCSVPPESNLFISGPGHQFVADPEGPLTSYRCNEFGHLCNGAPPPRTTTAQFPDGACVPAEERGQLIPVHDIVSQIRSVKADPNKILVAVIGGLPDPYGVDLVPPLIAQDPQMWPQVHHSCMVNSGEFADPGVRLAAFVKAFSENGLFLTICAPSFAPALQGIADQIGTLMDTSCLSKIAAGPDGQPDCQVSRLVPDATGVEVETPIPACSATGGAAPCWSLVKDPMCAGSGRLSVTRQGDGGAVSGTTLRASCATCLGPGDPLCI